MSELDRVMKASLSERLRSYNAYTKSGTNIHPKVCLEAADEIERLQRTQRVTVTEEMREAATKAVNSMKSTSGKWSDVFARKIADAALDALVACITELEQEQK